MHVAAILRKPLVVEAELPGKKLVGERASLYRLGLLIISFLVIGVIVNAVIHEFPMPCWLAILFKPAFLDDDSHVLPRLVKRNGAM
jgi:hypothetical protein